MTLILDGTNNILCPPVNGSELTLLQKSTISWLSIFRDTTVSEIPRLELFLGQVREFVQANVESDTILAVLLAHVAEILSENFLTSLVFFLGSIALSMFCQVASEG